MKSATEGGSPKPKSSRKSRADRSPAQGLGFFVLVRYQRDQRDQRDQRRPRRRRATRRTSSRTGPAAPRPALTKRRRAPGAIPSTVGHGQFGGGSSYAGCASDCALALQYLGCNVESRTSGFTTNATNATEGGWEYSY